MGTFRPTGHGGGHGYAAADVERELDGPRPTKKLRKLLPYFRPYRGKVALTLVLTLLVTASGLAVPALAQFAIDQGIRRGDRGTLLLAVGLFILAGLVGWAAAYGQSYLSSQVGERVLLDLRRRLFAHLMRLELGYHEQRATGRTVSRLTSDIEAIDQLVTDGATTLIINALTLVGMITILFLYDWQLALLMAILLPLLIFSTLVFRTYSTDAYRLTRERVGAVLARLQESLSGMRVVQGFGREAAATEAFAKVNDEYRVANLQTVKAASIYFPIVELLSAVGTALILFFGARRVLEGDLTVGVLVAFLGYLASFFDPIQSLSQLFNTFQSAMAALEKVLGVLETEPRLSDKASASALPQVKGEVVLDRVTFGYAEHPPVIHEVSLTIAPGQTVALVGATGAGKSTLAKLIARFYDPREGRVLIDGHDLRDVSLRSLRAQVGVVAQEGHLFSGTLRDNLRFARPDATDEQLLAACAAVGANVVVDDLPDGLDTEIEERGSRLSAGQRQLICIARALLTEPRLVILDEATSSVDIATERQIEAGMGTLLAGRTSIVIAHRLSTIRDADRIVVLADGRVAEEGTHAALIARGGVYAGLYADWQEQTATS